MSEEQLKLLMTWVEKRIDLKITEYARWDDLNVSIAESNARVALRRSFEFPKYKDK